MPTDDCQHLHTCIEITGSIRFIDGDVWDDTCEILVCQDCGETLTAAPELQPEFEFTF